MIVHKRWILFLFMFRIISGKLSSTIDVHATAATFVPSNPVELRGVYSSVRSKIMCAALCNQDPQCRTIVFDPPSCKLYESFLNTGSVIPSPSPSLSSIVGAINFDNISLASAYNQSCDRCYLDRYLVCTNNTCQCPLNSFWDGQDKCLNQLFVHSSLICENNNWCRQDLNLTCQYGKCQCPVQTFWNNQKCVPRFLQGVSCNTSDQCRVDLNLTCSRTNKTYTLMNLVTIHVINGTIPSKYSNLSIALDYPGFEWYRAFDGNTSTFWNGLTPTTTALSCILYTFDDLYLLTSLQLSVTGDQTHDPQTVNVFLDENGTYLAQSFSFPVAGSPYYTFPPSLFDYGHNPIVAMQVLFTFNQWSDWQVYLVELKLIGTLY